MLFKERTEKPTSGLEIAIRPLRPEDAGQLYALHQRLSPDTIYRRYFSPRKPSCRELENISRLNEVGGGALAAVRQGQIVGFAYYVTSDATTGEPAILVEDSYQRLGIGRRLAEALGQLARERGIGSFAALVLPENRPVLRLIQSGNIPYQARFSDGAREVYIQLRQA